VKGGDLGALALLWPPEKKKHKGVLPNKRGARGGIGQLERGRPPAKDEETVTFSTFTRGKVLDDQGGSSLGGSEQEAIPFRGGPTGGGE